MGQDREDGTGYPVSASKSRRRGFDSAPVRHSGSSTIVVDDIRNPGDAFIQAEIDQNAKYEWLLVPRALVAFAIVGILIVIRQAFFL